MRQYVPLIAAMAALAYQPYPAFAADILPGVYGLPEGQPKVTATLVATPEASGRVMLDIAMTAIGQPRPVTRYETELSKQLHVIASSSDFRTFVHEHGDHPDPDGHFRLVVPLPRAGSYHVYADGVPAGLGQQVMRFELEVGNAPAAPPAAAPKPSGLESADGRYTIRFDPFALRAGQASQLNLHIARNGQPAPEVMPFLGVAAHAVFIDAADLTYVHVHAAPAAGGSLPHDLTGKIVADAPPAIHDDAMAMMEGMANAPLPAGSHVPADLTLHILAPKAGTYLLWLQFMADGQVRTVPFTVAAT